MSHSVSKLDERRKRVISAVKAEHEALVGETGPGGAGPVRGKGRRCHAPPPRHRAREAAAHAPRPSQPSRAFPPRGSYDSALSPTLPQAGGGGGEEGVAQPQPRPFPPSAPPLALLADSLG